jgi:hypothetical protein
MFESKGGDDSPGKGGAEMEWSDVTVEGLRANRPDIESALITQAVEAKEKEHSTAIAEMEAKATTQATELAGLQQEKADREKAKEVDAVLAEAKITDKKAVETLTPVLRKCESKDDMVAIVGAAESAQTLSQERSGEDPKAFDDKDVKAAWDGQRKRR